MNEVSGEAIADALCSKGIDKACPMCGNDHWSVSESVTSLPLYTDLLCERRKWEHIPVAILVCENCGFISLHSPFTLGLMDEPLKQRKAEEERVQLKLQLATFKSKNTTPEKRELFDRFTTIFGRKAKV